MKKYIYIIIPILLLISYFFINSYNKIQIKVAIVDSGIDTLNKDIVESYDFINDSHSVKDDFGHGTNIYNIFKENISHKYHLNIYDLKVLDSNGLTNVDAYCDAVEYSIENDIDYIISSIGFRNSTTDLKRCINKAVKKGITIFAASGDNKKRKTDFPAKYDNVISIGAMDENYIPYTFTALDKIDYLELGVNIDLNPPIKNTNIASGSSFATPLFAAKYIENKRENSNLYFKEIKNNNRTFKILLYN